MKSTLIAPGICFSLYTFVGDASTVEKNLLDFQKVVKMDELIISIPQYDHAAKLKTIEMARGIFS